MSLADKNTCNNLNENRANNSLKDSQHVLRDADNHDGLIPDDALQKANPAAAELQNV